MNGLSGVQPGYYALGPMEMSRIAPREQQTGQKGVNGAILTVLNRYPASNENAGDGVNTLGYRFALPADSGFNTYIVPSAGISTATARKSCFWVERHKTSTSRNSCSFPASLRRTLDDSKGLTVAIRVASQLLSMT